MLWRTWLHIGVVGIIASSLAFPTEGQTSKQKSKGSNATAQSPVTASQPISSASPVPLKSPSPATPSTEYPADYIPCVFTLEELLGLRLKPVAATLTSSDDEDLKERLISEATTQEESNTLSPAMKREFLSKIGQASFEGLTPSQALASVIAILRDLETAERRLKQLEDAAKSPTVQSLINVAKQRLPMNVLASEDLPVVENNLTAGLDGDMNAVDRLRQLATNVSALFSGAKYSYVEFTYPILELTTDLQDAAAELQANPDTSDKSAENKEAQEESIAKQAIVDTARSTVAAFQRPLDVGCAMSILSWNEVRFAFGRVIANEYIGVQVVVRNLNDKQEFSLRRVSTTVRQVLTEFSEFFHLNSLVC